MDAVDPFRALLVGLVEHVESFGDGVEGDAYVHLLVVFIEHPLTNDGGGQGGDALLAVDEDLLARRQGAVLQLHVWIAPGDDVAYGVALVEGVDEVADLGGLPNKGALNLRDRNIARLDPTEERLDGLLVDGVFGHGSRRFC